MKLLLIDLETSPFLGYTWGKYDQTVLAFTEYSQIICMSWKWYGEPEVYAMALPDYRGYKKGKLNDKHLVKHLWKLLDRAEVVMGHNADRFDVKVANARFVFHNLTPPSPYQTIDTKKIAKRVGMFPSNKLDDLGQYFHVGKKMATGGFDLWQDCMKGDDAAWKKMKAYNKQDVMLLEEVYKRLLPWAPTHPNRNVFDEKTMNCPRCGSHKVQRRGWRAAATGRRRAFQCQDCGGWSSGQLVQLEEKVILR